MTHGARLRASRYGEASPLVTALGSGNNLTEENPMANPFVHIELSTTDTAKAKTF